MSSTTASLDVDVHERSRWVAAGLDRLTGPVDGPALGPPAGFVGRLDALTARLTAAGAALDAQVDVDGLGALAVRAELLDHTRQGQVSCGGSCHLVRADDGWFAVSLARPDDWELLPAWLGVGDVDHDWDEVHRAARTSSVADAVERGVLLGLPIGALGERSHRPAAEVHLTAAPSGASPTRSAPRTLRSLRVADLSSMWAGPLCGSILAAGGAEVLKVESLHRPDGTRSGPAAFHDLLNGEKRTVVVDLTTSDGIAELQQLLRSVDVVIESSRPRALRQLGIRAEELLDAPDGPALWLSITGHGRDGVDGDRVAFGDDAAVSGGLVSWWEGRPHFCADAVADPLTGLWAAAAVLEALVDGRRGLLDVAMSGVAARFADGAPDPGPERTE